MRKKWCFLAVLLVCLGLFCARYVSINKKYPGPFQYKVGQGESFTYHNVDITVTHFYPFVRSNYFASDWAGWDQRDFEFVLVDTYPVEYKVSLLIQACEISGAMIQYFQKLVQAI